MNICVNCCVNCDDKLCKVYYKCTDTDFRYVFDDDELLYIKSEHDIKEGDIERETCIMNMYCKCCNKFVDYPVEYDGDIFKNGDTIITFYKDHLSKNIIHQFTDITCKHCNTNVLKKGYFTNTEMIQSDENLLQYSYPTDFTNTIHIYDEEDIKIKDIIINLNDLDIPETDIGKKILYCPNCKYFITNHLKEIYINSFI